MSKGSVFLRVMLVLHSLLTAEDFFVPQEFQNGEPIEQVILISDVDGVIRDSTEAIADPRIIHAIKSLLENKDVDVTFISGTPIDNDLTVEPWRRSNVPLNTVFGESFTEELLEKRVTIYGVLGGHRMKEDGTLEIVNEYSPEISWELSTLLIRGFLKEVLDYGSASQQDVAKRLQVELDFLTPKELNSSNLTASEFYQIVGPIRQYLDPNFRLVNNGALIETHTSNPPWRTRLSSEWLRNEINQPDYLVSHLPLSRKQIATGFAKKGDEGFNYLLISNTNKGLTIEEHLKAKLKTLPKALVITIGDTEVDFSMHKKAHLAVHVGLEQVWLNHPLPNCIMIRNTMGEDHQHVEGTLKVLSLLEDAIGKSFYDFKYIPRCDSSGQWDYYSIRELQKET